MLVAKGRLEAPAPVHLGQSLAPWCSLALHPQHGLSQVCILGSLEAGWAAAEGTDRLILTSRDLQDPSLHHQTATPLCWNRQRKGSSRCSQGQQGHFLPRFQNLTQRFSFISFPEPGLLSRSKARGNLCSNRTLKYPFVLTVCLVRGQGLGLDSRKAETKSLS